MKNSISVHTWDVSHPEQKQSQAITTQVTASHTKILDIHESVESWDTLDIGKIYELEKKCWVPWLEASYSSLKWRACIFPAGQIALISKEPKEAIISASLSLNQMYWDGDVDSLPSWDAVAWDPTTYEQTYDPNGNALVLMSMNVHEKYHWAHAHLLAATKKLAIEKDIPYIIGSFRPNKFWAYIDNLWQQYGTDYFTDMDLDQLFEEYIQKESEWKSLDQWLGILKKKYGMKPLKIDTSAMIVSVTSAEFHEYKKIDAEKWIIWHNIKDNIWSCWQTGFWYLDGDGAVYQESNVWWLIPNQQ